MVVYVHIGCPKSGTTYLQEILGRHRRRLAADGVLWPGRRWVDQVLAARELLGAHPHGQRPQEVDGAWQRLVDEVHAWQGHAVVISMEWLVTARPTEIRRAAESLAPHEVRVVVTARDLARTVPAQWQESVQNWETWTWSDYLRDVTSAQPERTRAGAQLFAQHDLGRILRTWAEVVPADRITLVTVPAAGSDPRLLWARFGQLFGIDPAPYQPQGRRQANASLGAASSELMRRVNLATQDQGLSWQDGDPILKWLLAKAILSRRRGQEDKLVLPTEHHAWAQQVAKRFISEVEQLGVPVVGDLAELIPVAESGVTDPVVAEQIADAAVDGLAGLAVQLAEQRKRTQAGQQNRNPADRNLASRTAARVGGSILQHPALRRGLATYRRIRAMSARARRR